MHFPHFSPIFQNPTLRLIFLASISSNPASQHCGPFNLVRCSDLIPAEAAAPEDGAVPTSFLSEAAGSASRNF